VVTGMTEIVKFLFVSFSDCPWDEVDELFSTATPPRAEQNYIDYLTLTA
jgi:hypothetical protein